MRLRWAVTILVAAILAAALGAVAIFAPPRWYRKPAAGAGVAATPSAPATPGRKIKARLFYVSEDGASLISVEREVPFADGADQAREILLAQIAPPIEPFVSAVPPGTGLRSIFMTERGEAYVDLSREVASAHTGGTMNELLTVYTIVNALTTNLPAVHAVQILVDGHEVQTLAGHVDLRQPLTAIAGLVQ